MPEKLNVVIVLIMLLACSWAWGAYDATPVEVMAGGYGGVGVANPTGPTGTVFDAGISCMVAGKIKTVRLSLWTNSGSAPVLGVKFKVMRGSSSQYTVVSDADITSQVNAVKTAGYFTVTIDMSSYNLSIAVGDYIGMYLPGGLYVATETGITGGKYGRNGGHLGNIDEMPPQTTGTFDTYTTTYLMIDYTVTTTAFLASTNTNSGSGFAKDAVITLPYFINQNQYVVLKNVHGVADEENLSIDLYYTKSDAVNTKIDSVVLNRVGTETISVITGSK